MKTPQEGLDFSQEVYKQLNTRLIMVDVLRPSPKGADKFRSPSNQGAELLGSTELTQPQSSIDNIGSPDYSALNEEARLREVRASLNPTPNRAEFFLREGTLDFPLGYREPGPFEIEGAEQWENFTRRRRYIESRIEDALKGTF